MINFWIVTLISKDRIENSFRFGDKSVFLSFNIIFPMADIAAFLVLSALSGTVLLLPSKSRNTENASSLNTEGQSVNLLQLRRDLENNQGKQGQIDESQRP